MPTLDFKHSILEFIQKINGIEHRWEEWSDWLPDIGCPVDRNDEQSVEVEVFPDRPDLLSPVSYTHLTLPTKRIV